MRITIRDIAKQTGMSKSAVGYALSGSPEVSESTRERVRAVADALGWQPNVAARSLARSRADAIGFVSRLSETGRWTEPFYMDFIKGLETTVSAEQCALLMSVASSVEQEIEVYRRWWAGGRIDGVVLTDIATDDPRIAVLSEIGLPFVCVSPRGFVDSAPIIATDEASAAALIAEHLIGLGHHDIARVTGLPSLASVATRSKVFDDLTSARGRASVRTVNADFSVAGGSAATQGLLSGDRPPTAIIYDNDVMAAAGLQVATALGVKVPEHLSIIAWDDSFLCAVTSPPLTALTRDVSVIGSQAGDLLMRAIARDRVTDLDGPAHVLTARASTGRAPS